MGHSAIVRVMSIGALPYLPPRRLVRALPALICLDGSARFTQPSHTSFDGCLAGPSHPKMLWCNISKNSRFVV